MLWERCKRSAMSLTRHKYQQVVGVLQFFWQFFGRLFINLGLPLKKKALPVGNPRNFKARTDEELQELFLRGEDHALAFLFDKYSSRLLHHAMGVLRNQLDAEDVVYNVLVKFYQELPKQKIDNVYNWLLRVTHNDSLSLLGKKKKSNLQSIDGIDLAVLPSEKTLYEGEVSYSQLSALVFKAIADFDADKQFVMVHRIFNDDSTAQLAKEMSLPEAKVKNLYDAGIKTVRRKLKKLNLGTEIDFQ